MPQSSGFHHCPQGRLATGRHLGLSQLRGHDATGTQGAEASDTSCCCTGWLHLRRVHGVGVENPGLESGSLKGCRCSLFLSRSAPPLSCPSPFASAHLPPPPSGFTHPHVCTQSHKISAPGIQHIRLLTCSRTHRKIWEVCPALN